jgi:hypothetical protein
MTLWGWVGPQLGKLHVFTSRKKYFKNLFKNPWIKLVEIYMKALWHSTKKSLVKSWPPGVRWGQNRGNFLHMLIKEHILKISRTNEPIELKFT